MTPQHPARTPYWLLVLFVALASAIAGLAYRYHLAQKDAVAHEVGNQLLAIADMKVKHISAWRSEKLGEGRMVLQSRFTLEAVQRTVAGRSSAAEKAFVTAWLDALCGELHYAGVTLTDSHGNTVLSRGRVFGDREHLEKLAVAVAATSDVALTDFHIDSAAPAHLGLNVPLRLEAGAPAFGALLAGLDPGDYLFPMLVRWPVPSASGESLLVRRDGDEVVFLSPLRKGGSAGAGSRVSISRSDVAAVRAVIGETGVLEAVDYRGAPVFAAVQAIPDTPWRLVAKIDAEEVLAPQRWRFRLMSALAIALIGMAAAVVFVLWRRHELRSYRARYQSELQRREAAEAYDTERKAMNEELRRALDALRASESAFRAAFEQVAVGMNQVSLDGRFLQVNQRYCEITGYSREELMELRFSDITHPEDRAADLDRAAPIVRGDIPNDRWEKRYIRKDGSIIWAAITTSLMRSPSGEAVHLLAVVEDITARVLAEEALRQSEERFRQVVEHAPDAIMVDTALRLRYMNPAAARLFGAESTQQLTGSSVLDRVHPEDWARVRERSATVLAGQPVPETEQHYVRLSGETFPAEVSATPIVYDGQPAALVFFRDATDRKRAAEERVRLEQRLAQAQKMESVGRLAGGVAHDFNNHLTVINGYCDMLLEALAVDDPLHDELGEIRAAGDRAAVLTQQLLAFSRKQLVEPRPIALNEVVEEYSRLARRLIGDDIQILTELDPAQSVVMADRGQIHQVLMNLGVNARDAMPHGGQITIATGNAEIDGPDSQAQEVKPGPYVVLTVRDTGMGMSPETLQKIFEPFFTTKPLGVGTGLGLATVYGIVQQSGGFIRVESQPGEGTTFRLYFPRIWADPEAVSVRPSSSTALRGTETVLVVEDQDDVRKLALGILRKNGYRLLSASNGADALKLAESFAEPIALLVTDVIMPGMTGRELASRLLLARPAMKVLYISGYTADVIAHEGVLASGVAYLAKPFAPADFAAKIREVLSDPAPPAPRA